MSSVKAWRICARGNQITNWLFDLDPRLLNQLAVLIQFRAHEITEVLGRIADAIAAELA
jgi:hypothetical protein